MYESVGGYHKGGVEFPPYEITSVHDLRSSGVSGCPSSAAGGIQFKFVLIGNSFADENTYRFASEGKQAELAPQARRECTNLWGIS